ncbi:MAG: ActS/PrrB/RegB family redox-sensitive histidine kinase [Bauldia sp.]|uniref:ActS/PrrB/RegB family redox-sensitive histidine kinase n=1 Tax=Bauldia sp. TaxID=2575872 RepID=UPI001D59DAE7|nr:ActS/PrrB/RegB family redox-sensitive histidine kinase [Bauldia sp.]MCB1496414.1 ActS/PrrB/RegB family redox-sensitive histidine kinase [Bauldia sp.]
MTALPLTASDLTGHSLRLETLVRLRWLAVAGQTAAVFFAHLVLGFPLPLALCLGLIGLSALLNIGLGLRYPASQRLRGGAAFWLLAYDILQLGGLLLLTGGLDNPFAILLLVPVIVSATTLAPRPTMLLGAMVIATATLLAVWHWPLPWYPGETLALPPIFSAGVWIALVSACAFTGIYAFRVTEEARQLARALNETEMVLAREQHLSALDGLAAAAAHELGTPLATIALVAKELERELPADSPHGEDISLLKSQAQRCRDILTKLTSLSSELDHPHTHQPLSHLIEELVEPYRDCAVEIAVAPSSGAGTEPVGRRNPAIIQGLANLVENAIDFASKRVDIATKWTPDDVTVTIADDGPGFAPGILERIGEPYVTTRGRSVDNRTDERAGGLGLGLFIAKTILERTGARLTMANRERPERGAIVRITWPRALFDAPAGDPAPAKSARSTWRAEIESL